MSSSRLFSFSSISPMFFPHPLPCQLFRRTSTHLRALRHRPYHHSPYLTPLRQRLAVHRYPRMWSSSFPANSQSYGNIASLGIHHRGPCENLAFPAGNQPRC